MQHLDFDTIFYGYTFVYILTKTISIFKRRHDKELSDALDINFNFNDLQGSLADLQARGDRVKELAKSSTYDKISSMFNFSNFAWIICGLYTPYKPFFIAIIVSTAAMMVFFISKMFRNHNYETMKHITTISSVFELCIAVLVAYNHFFQH